MNERLPYEEQLTQKLDNLPLPDENMAWEDMRRRLDDDDDGGIIPIWLRGCGPWILVAIVLLGLGWWFIRPDKWMNKKQEAGSEQTITQKGNAPDSLKIADTVQLQDKTQKQNKISGVPGIVKDSSDEMIVEDSDATSNKRVVQQQNDRQVKPRSGILTGRKVGINQTKKKSQPVARKREARKQDVKVKQGISTQLSAAGKKENRDVDETKTKSPIQSNDTAIAPKIPTVDIGKTDTATKKTPVDSTINKDSLFAAKVNEPKRDSSKPKSISFSAGLGMHQLIPVGGQQLTPYNSQGRTGSLADYIPSVFARMYKNEKWFLQLEFRYGAPQTAEQILYAQTSRIDSIGGVHYTTTESYQLKKTFYHQLPLTFNYFLTKDWSVGGGIVWNKFYSAVSEQTINMKNSATQVDSVISKGIVSTLDDTATTSSGALARSAFHASYFQALIETHYRWKRLSIGIKYSFGLQPYIETKLAGQPSQQERNRSLQVFLRYELWKSKPKKQN